MPRKIKISYMEDKLEMLFLNSEEIVRDQYNVRKDKL